MNQFSTEQVSKYHPDKYADQISDAILTAYLMRDPKSHCGIETMVKNDIVVLGGEIKSNVVGKGVVNHADIAKRVGKKLGYNVNSVIDLIGQQSPEIDGAVGDAEGAGDQGMMFGYATNETASYLPLGFDLANTVIKTIEEDVEENPNTILLGDAKTQVSMDRSTRKLHGILVSVCHKDGIDVHEVDKYIRELLCRKLYEGFEPYLFINPAGAWTLGGPTADCGLTGRKIVCDQYGGYCPVGGGAFSGKDPSKVDRSASYMARKIAIDMLKKYELKWCEIQLAYAIGVANPTSINVDNDKKLDLAKEISAEYDLTPQGIIRHLDLLNVDYEKLSEGCHYRNIDLPKIQAR